MNKITTRSAKTRRVRSQLHQATIDRLEHRMLFTTVVVNTIVDATFPPGGGTTSLRDAIAIANASTSETTISFDPTVFATAQSIGLDGNDLELTNTTQQTNIVGPTAGVTINAADQSAGIVIDASVTANISEITVTNANTNGISNAGALTLTQSAIINNNSGNTSINSGGGLTNTGTAALLNVVVSGNTTHIVNANGAGGVFSSGMLTLNNVTISNNTESTGVGGGGVADGGGGLENDGQATLTAVTLSGNIATASYGNFGAAYAAGGFLNNGTANLTNVTVADNSGAGQSGSVGASFGTGGVLNLSAITLLNTTISGNIGSSVDNTAGGGIYNGAASTAFTVENSIIASNTTPGQTTAEDAQGAFNSLGYNLIGITDGSTGFTIADLTGTAAAPLDPQLGALASNGGPTDTLLPAAGSPAIDHGNNAYLAGLITDQRGLARIVGSSVDIGSVEVALTQLAFTQQPANATTTQTLGTVVVDVQDSSGNVITTDNSTVTLSITGSPAGVTLGGTVTATAVNGVATFTGLTISTAGTYTLTATDTGVTAATSSSVTISVSSAPAFYVSTYTDTIDTVGYDGSVVAYKSGLIFPRGVVLDSSGNLYTTQIGNSDTILKITPSGTTTTFASGLGLPIGLVFDGSGNLYCANYNDGTISKITPAGVASTFASGLNSPEALAIDTSGNLYTVSFVQGTVSMITPGGIVSTFGTGLDQPYGIAIGSDGTVYASSYGNGTISKVTASGTTSYVSGLQGPCGLAFDGFGNLYCANLTDGTVSKITSAGVVSTLASGLNQPEFLVSATAGLASQLAFSQQPTRSTSNAVIPSFTVADADPSAPDVTIAIASGPSGVTLGGTTTATAVGGVAAFGNLSITTPGNYTLTVSDGTDQAVTSDNFTIFPPAETIGTLDPVFSSAGLVSHNVGFTATDGTAQDGAQSVIVGTVGASPSESFGVTRYDSDGSLDTAFGTAGVVSSSFAGTDDVPGAVDVLGSGDILVAGTATRFAGGVGGAATGSEFVVAEYTAAGALDTSFGGGSGFAMVSFAAAGASSGDVLKSMIVSSTGAIYLGGESNASGTTGEDFAIASLTSGGSLNTGFNTTGKELLDFSGGDDIANSLALQANGDLVAAGSATITGITEIALARFVPTGVLDKHFGTRGTTTTNVRGVYDSASSVVIQPRGQIVIGGISATGSAAALGSDFVVARFTASGKIDKSFGNGPVITSFGQPSGITQIVLQPDGEIIASGKTTGSLTDISNLQLAVARYTTRGVLDTTFNGTGKNIVDLSGIATTNALPAAMLDAAQDLLGSAFNAFTSSEQGVVSITPGGEILDAGNSGANTVEAELIAAGVDLVTSLIGTIPTAITGGSKGAASVAIVEDGTDQATGSVTIDLQVAADALGDGATTFKTLPEKINLHQKQAHSYHLAFVYPTGLTAGNYYLVAVVDNGTTPALQDLNDENNLAASKTAVDIAPPFISIAGAGLSTSSTFIAGKTARVIFTLANDGNVPARGSIAVDIILSTDQTTADGTNVDTGKLPVNLNPGKPHVYPLSFKLPTIAAGTYYLIAVIDPADSLGATDQTSSVIVDPTQVVVK